jgi:hypothetical protein
LLQQLWRKSKVPAASKSGNQSETNFSRNDLRERVATFAFCVQVNIGFQDSSECELAGKGCICCDSAATSCDTGRCLLLESRPCA